MSGKSSNSDDENFSKPFESDEEINLDKTNGDNNSDETELSESDEDYVTSENNKENDEDLNSKDPYEFFIAEKINSLLKNDVNRKYPLIAVLGIVFGLIFIITATTLFLGSGEKVVDNVSFEENKMISALIGLIGLIILGLSIFRLLQKKLLLGSVLKSLDNINLEGNLNSKSKNNEDSNGDKKTLQDNTDRKSKDNNENHVNQQKQ